MPAVTTRQEATARKRGEILDAALRVFDERGVMGATMEDIRLAARVSVGSLYHHFPNKEAIAGSLYVSLIDDYQRAAYGAVAPARTPRARIRAAIKHHVEWSISNRTATRFLLAHREPEVQKMSDPQVKTMNQDLEAKLQEWLDAEADQGRIRRISADIYVSLVIGSAQSFVRRWMLGSTSTTPARAVDSLSEAAWRAVRADQPHRQQRGG